ncbi:MAG TPA: hypothetical protein VM367_16780 [Pseudonocardia sp.]|nr:hypothetical protein [Pseudonocardia sp.]
MTAPAAPEPVPGPPPRDRRYVVQAWIAAAVAGALLTVAVLTAVWGSPFFAIALAVLAVFAAVDASWRVRRPRP